MPEIELTIVPKEKTVLFCPSLFETIKSGDRNWLLKDTDFPRIEDTPRLRFGQDGSSVYMWIERFRFEDPVKDSNKPDDLPEQGDFDFSVFLNLDKQEIRHIHAFLSSVLNDTKDYSE